MADDRYDWLDKDAAERLLRGERVDAGHGIGVKELNALLSTAAATGAHPAADAVLPGEETAVAAFRQAAAGRRTAPRGVATGSDVTHGGGIGDEIPVVRTVRTENTSRTSERTRLGRPVRRGFVVALAGCALGGVAVAAGTGVIPTPFHGHPAEPAPSVSAAATPGTPEDTDPDEETDDTARTPDPDRTQAGTRTPSLLDDTPPRGDDGNHGEGHDKPSKANPTKGDADAARRQKRRAAVLALCRDYEADRIKPKDRERVRRLERAAGGADQLHSACRGYLQRSSTPDDGSGGNPSLTGGSSGSSGGNGNGPEGDHGSDEGGKNGGDDDDEGHQGPSPAPSTTISTPTPTPSQEPTEPPAQTPGAGSTAAPSTTPAPTATR